jgi:hypothetical protein
MMVGMTLVSVALGILIGVWVPGMIGRLLMLGEHRRHASLVIQEANDRALQQVRVPQQRFRSLVETEEAARIAAGHQ